MLRIFTSSRELKVGKLMQLYFQDFSDSPRLLKAEQDFYSYVLEFLRQEGCFYAIWEEDGSYISALRMEPYQDGILVEGLATDTAYRKKGYAKTLLKKATDHALSMGFDRVYSHIAGDNKASIATHTACGFQKLQDYAVFIDGSVNHKNFTYMYERGCIKTLF